MKIVAAEDVDATKEPTAGAPLDLTTRFRLWLDETELRNSAAVPGGAETQRILKILQTESASGDIVDKILKVLRMVAAIAFPETGFTVVLASRCFAGHGPARKQWKVTGRLTDTRNRSRARPAREHG